MKTYWLWIALLSCLCLALPRWLFGLPLLVYNASPSAPIGWYWLDPVGPLSSGQYVVAGIPQSAAALADQRGYLPQDVPLLKPVAAQYGQLVCERNRTVAIGGRIVATALIADHSGRALPAWTMCRRLTANELFLLNAHRLDSFDSRYFGPIDRSRVLGTARPLWTW